MRFRVDDVGDADRLATFYREVLGCRLLSPVTDFADEALSRGFGAAGARVRLAFLGLPGIEEGPTLELYQLPDEDQIPVALSTRSGSPRLPGRRRGTSGAARGRGGGSYLGEIVTWRAPSGNPASFVFMRDPEGNVIDLWARGESG